VHHARLPPRHGVRIRPSPGAQDVRPPIPCKKTNQSLY
jgi:hypothetical protein